MNAGIQEGMNNKHKAVWGVAVFVAIFAALLIWYMATHRAPVAQTPIQQTATTSPSTLGAKHIVDNGQYYEIDTAYPAETPLKASAGAAADAQAVEAMRAFEQNTINAFKENAGITDLSVDELARIKQQNLMYSMKIDYKLYTSPHTISYVFPIFQDTLGAHPNTYYRTFTFNCDTGALLGLSDLFVPGADYLNRLSTRTRADLPKIMGKMAETAPENIDASYIASGTLPIDDAFQNFAIDNGTLLIIFPPYQVGAYVYGAITDPIPLTDLKDILSPNYRP